MRHKMFILNNFCTHAPTPFDQATDEDANNNDDDVQYSRIIYYLMGFREHSEKCVE